MYLLPHLLDEMVQFGVGDFQRLKFGILYKFLVSVPGSELMRYLFTLGHIQVLLSLISKLEQMKDTVFYTSGDPTDQI